MVPWCGVRGLESRLLLLRSSHKEEAGRVRERISSRLSRCERHSGHRKCGSADGGQRKLVARPEPNLCVRRIAAQRAIRPCTRERVLALDQRQYDKGPKNVTSVNLSTIIRVSSALPILAS
uniref:SFRICE_017908 n=1 Tax=Spodoptera frugiperda TaxID=7108 RepID=A0A2H1VZ66_SPOFR